jgi:glutamyl-tRNA synthetase
LHLGNARTFLVNWLLARQQGWRIILRIEDLDGPRIKRGADALAIEDLRWLGIDWDEGPIYQSARQGKYDDALQRLINTGATFFCICSRKDVEQAASAPHAANGAVIYPGTCRNVIYDLKPGTPIAVRFRVPDEVITFDDVFAGKRSFDVARQLGDFVISKSDGTAYQLAVVVDDADMRVTDVVRGDDLLDSTPRQILLYRALGIEDRIPAYCHLPLVIGPDGRRLAKRHGDTRLATYRDAGVPASRVLALLASWCGIDATDDDLRSAADLLGRFDLARLPRGPIIFDPSGDAALRLESRRP